MEGCERALRLLPEELRPAAREAAGPDCEELRLRIGRSVGVLADGREWRAAGPRVTEAALREVLERASCASFQSVESQIRDGYVMAPGGLRIGICGTAVMRGGRAEGLRDFTSLCIRIPHERRGCADGIYPALTRPAFVSTLVYSAPGAGKTTLLRELVRRLSDDGLRTAVADERGEIAGMPETGGGFSLGEHTDVLTALPKAQAVLQLVRTMSPQLVAMDEITEPADAAALLAAAGCGTALLATVHAGSLDPLRTRPVMRRLLEAGVFRRAVGIGRRDGGRVYEVSEL